MWFWMVCLGDVRITRRRWVGVRRWYERLWLAILVDSNSNDLDVHLIAYAWDTIESFDDRDSFNNS